MQNIEQLKNLSQHSFDAGEVFSGRKSGTSVLGYAQRSEYTPLNNPSYLFDTDSTRDIIVWFLNNNPEPLYLFGPTGCGKTSCLKQLASRLNYPVFECNGHDALEFSDLIGHQIVRKNSMEYDYGPLSLAMKFGAIFLLNEIDIVSASVASGLNTILDGSPLCVSDNGGELITPNPMFRFVATANTNGNGDESGLYLGTQRQNMAYLDRFVLCEMHYPRDSVEESLIEAKYPQLPENIRKGMVNLANKVRELFTKENSIEVTFSTRSLLRWADLTVRYQPLSKAGIQPVTYALDRALAFRASKESQAMLHELCQRIFGNMSL